MLDLSNGHVRMLIVDREDKALLRSNLSARSMPGDGQGHVYCHMLLSSCPSLGSKAINLIVRDEAQNNAKTKKMTYRSDICLYLQPDVLLEANFVKLYVIVK